MVLLLPTIVTMLHPLAIQTLMHTFTTLMPIMGQETLGEILMLPPMLTITCTIGIRIIMPMQLKPQITMLQPNTLRGTVKLQHTTPQQHIMKTHTGITMEEDTSHTTTPHMVGCITGLMLHGIADIR
jgi:hypothetical protein